MAGTNGTETMAMPSTLAEARDMILQHEARANAEYYRIGRIFNHVVEKGLAGACTEESARSYLGPWIKSFSPSTLIEYATVAQEFSEEVCRKYGMHALRLLLGYARKHNVPVSGIDPGMMLLRIPGAPVDKKRKPFVQCTREELGRALSAEPPTPQDSGGSSRVDLYCLQLLRDGLRRRYKQNVPYAHASVHYGRLQITLKDIPVDRLEWLAEAIRDSLKPLRAERQRKAQAQRPVLHAVPDPRVGESASVATALRAP